MSVSFQIGGQSFLALNGGPPFKFTGAISTKSRRVIEAMLKMRKTNIQALEKAHQGA
jgi:predicted 3-demethylubiquinone-9 3-methyltransferase (glyoxalase superfamily)